MSIDTPTIAAARRVFWWAFGLTLLLKLALAVRPFLTTRAVTRLVAVSRSFWRTVYSPSYSPGRTSVIRTAAVAPAICKVTAASGVPLSVKASTSPGRTRNAEGTHGARRKQTGSCQKQP